MSAQIIDGKAAAQQLCDELKEKIANLAEDKRPGLAVILAGDNEASHIYVRNKQKKALSVGIDCKVIELAESIGENALLSIIDELNHDEDVNGIIVQLPLPKHLDEFKIISAIASSKDVDGFTPYNTGLNAYNREDAFVSATPLGVLKLLQQTKVNLAGKHAVIIGRSNIVGKPMSRLLLNCDCTVTITHSLTQNLSDITRMADILVSACGQPKMIKADWVKEGAIVMDIGITRVDGKICGDVDFDEVKDKASFITPVPGGVGPMTIACLLENTYKAFLASPQKECHCRNHEHECACEHKHCH